MDSTTIRIVCAALALLIGGVIFLRRKRKED